MDFGAAVSQKGYDVKTCADRFLVYSSAFQTLKFIPAITAQTTKPSSGSGITNVVTITHNLGYFVPYIVVYNGNTTDGVGMSYFFTDSDIPLRTRCYTDRIEIDVDESFDFSAADGATVYFTVYVCLDDFRTIAENNINTSTSIGATSNDYGFRISKDGFDVKTCADIDCVISSSFLNKIIHKKGISTAASISHNLGYIPEYLAYDNLAGGASYINFTDPAFSGITTSALTLISGSNNYYIILKNRVN